LIPLDATQKPPKRRRDKNSHVQCHMIKTRNTCQLTPSAASVNLQGTSPRFLLIPYLSSLDSIFPIFPILLPAMDATRKEPRTLGDLPDELLIQTFSLLTAQRDLASLCLVSRRINTVADPVLYKSISWNEPKHHLTFSESLIARPRRGSLIQDVVLEYPSSELSDVMRLSLSDSPHRIDRFSHTISTMSNLERLVVSVPESLCHGIGVLFNSPFDLACLKSCKSLH
jgi:hypothetical protein